ncbi:nuclear transport factor 2 family protein [Mucilaginibacter hurinus]|uniref:Nuclear transport factor 2 family protein n=1 Tax=Mucilaginibacter hurinus TaxID=2201324 RepID=A0A367GL50_9SPHI|nr:nuclear transport factor 2 family protein [Mucilaginibacter hurinus]RCH54204.1 nuclear transport factor 2 family protein [Mucilaginibacter hurinus]
MSISIAAAPSQDTQEVAQVVERLRKAMVDADGVTLANLTSEHLSYGHSAGKLETKQEFINTIISGKSVFTSISLTDQSIKVINSTALVRHTFTAETNDKGKGAGFVKLSVLSVWVKGEQGWQMVARQAVKAD